jgi:hypothetical protein
MVCMACFVQELIEFFVKNVVLFAFGFKSQWILDRCPKGLAILIVIAAKGKKNQRCVCVCCNE